MANDELRSFSTKNGYHKLARESLKAWWQVCRSKKRERKFQCENILTRTYANTSPTMFSTTMTSTTCKQAFAAEDHIAKASIEEKDEEKTIPFLRWVFCRSFFVALLSCQKIGLQFRFLKSIIPLLERYLQEGRYWYNGDVVCLQIWFFPAFSVIVKQPPMAFSFQIWGIITCFWIPR